MPKLCRYLPRAIISLYFIILQHNNMCIHILFGIMCVIILALFPIHWRYPNWGQIGNESERIYSGGQGYWSYLWGLRGKRSEKDVMGGGGRGGGGVGRRRGREAVTQKEVIHIWGSTWRLPAMLQRAKRINLPLDILSLKLITTLHLIQSTEHCIEKYLHLFIFISWKIDRFI